LRRLISASQHSFLLSRLEPDVLARLAPNLSVVDLEQHEVLAETHRRIQKVYFPHTGIFSCVVELVGGGAIETGKIGKDGEFDASQALDDKVSLNHIVIQVPGTASVIDSDCIKEMAHELPAFRGLLVKYEQFFLSQVQQTAACNAVHTVQARTCKWLLRMHEFAGSDLPLTQDFLAQMMGVRRTSVTEFRRPKRCLTGCYVSEEIAPDKRGGRMQLQLPHPLLLGHISFVTPPLAGKGSRKSRSRTAAMFSYKIHRRRV
jgi:CRP-like cAMP-binding protein